MPNAPGRDIDRIHLSSRGELRVIRAGLMINFGDQILQMMRSFSARRANTGVMPHTLSSGFSETGMRREHDGHVL